MREVTPSFIVAAPAQAAPVSTTGTEPIYDYGRAIGKRVWVESEVDSDGDGRRDRVAVRVIRPADAPKVPVILQASPYYAGLNDLPNHDVDIDAAARSAAASGARAAESIILPGYLDNYFVPRGYAVAFADSLGTTRSWKLGAAGSCERQGARDGRARERTQPESEVDGNATTSGLVRQAESSGS